LKEDDFVALLYRCAYVNRSSTGIPVYSKRAASSVHNGSISVDKSTRIGTIYQNEFYTVVPNDSSNITCYKIYFRNSSGQQASGYIETSPGLTLGDYAWASYQEPYMYYNSNGTTLIASATETIGGKTYRIFTVHGYARGYRKTNGDYVGTLSVGTKLATTSSTSGVNFPGYMQFFKKKIPGGSWQDLISGATYGFVDLGLSVGSTPSTRPIR